MSKRERILTALSSTLAVALIAVSIYAFQPAQVAPIDDTTEVITEGDVSIVDNEDIPELFPTKRANVLDYGAKGDGVTDDTAAIIKALDALPPTGGTLFFPTPSSRYLITGTIPLRSNVEYVGEGSEIYMESNPNGSGRVMLGGNDTKNNILIEGLVFRSSNDYLGPVGSYYENQYISNNTAIKFSRTSNLIIRDVYVDSMMYGFKIDSADNSDILIDNFTVVNTMTGGYLSNSRNVTIVNSYFDSTGATNSHLHNIYISLNTFNITVDNTYFTNTPGAALHLYHPTTALIGGTFTNLTFDNCIIGLYATNRSTDLLLDNFYSVNTYTPVKIYDAHGITVRNGYVDMRSNGFYIDKSYDLQMSNVYLNGSTAEKGGNVMTVNGNNITFDNISADNLTGLTNVAYASSRAATNITVQNSLFRHSSVSGYPVSFRNAEHSVDFLDNHFINTGSQRSLLSYSPSGGDVLLKNNTMNGYNYSAHSSDVTVVDNSLNISKSSYEVSKYSFVPADSDTVAFAADVDFVSPDKSAFGANQN